MASGQNSISKYRDTRINQSSTFVFGKCGYPDNLEFIISIRLADFFFSVYDIILLSLTFTPGNLLSTFLYLLSMGIKFSRLCLDTSTSRVPRVLVYPLLSLHLQYTTHAKQFPVKHYTQNFRALTILVSS